MLFALAKGIIHSSQNLNGLDRSTEHLMNSEALSAKSSKNAQHASVIFDTGISVFKLCNVTSENTYS